MPPPTTAASAALARPERGQTKIGFGGTVYRPVRPGPLPDERRTEVPAGAPLVGGLNELEAIQVAAAAQQRFEELRNAVSLNSDAATLPQLRRSYTREEKLRFIEYCEKTWVPEAGKQPAHRISLYQASSKLGISDVQLGNWMRKKQSIIAQRKGTRRNRDLRYTVGREEEMETRLFELFKTARSKGRGCPRSWFYRQARLLYRSIHPERCILSAGGGYTYLKFRFSNTWFQGFRRRFRISNRCKTKQAQKAPAELYTKVQRWMQYNRRHTIINPTSHVGNGPAAPAVGRFKLSEIANMDQTPLAFEFLDQRTYDFKGAETVWIKETRSGWDKRQATLQLCVFADGVKRCKPQLIFHGAEVGKRARKLEMEEYHKGVEVIFNPDAYANEKTIIQWVKKQYRYATAYMLSHKEPRLLSFDAFTAHMTKDVVNELQQIHCTPSFIPGGCTGYVQVLDVALNQPLKALVKDLADQHYHNNEEDWESGKWSRVRDRRVLLTHWVAEAWDLLHSKYQDTIIAAFRKVGLSLNPDGSEDAEIKIKGLEGMEVGDWRLNLDSFEPQQEEVANLVSTMRAEAAAEKQRNARAKLVADKRASKAADILSRSDSTASLEPSSGPAGLTTTSQPQELTAEALKAKLPSFKGLTPAQRRRRAAEYFFLEEDEEMIVNEGPDDVTTDSGAETGEDSSGLSDLDNEWADAVEL